MIEVFINKRKNSIMFKQYDKKILFEDIKSCDDESYLVTRGKWRLNYTIIIYDSFGKPKRKIKSKNSYGLYDLSLFFRNYLIKDSMSTYPTTSYELDNAKLYSKDEKDNYKIDITGQTSACSDIHCNLKISIVDNVEGCFQPLVFHMLNLEDLRKINKSFEVLFKNISFKNNYYLDKKFNEFCGNKVFVKGDTRGNGLIIYPKERNNIYNNDIFNTGVKRFFFVKKYFSVYFMYEDKETKSLRTREGKIVDITKDSISIKTEYDLMKFKYDEVAILSKYYSYFDKLGDSETYSISFIKLFINFVPSILNDFKTLDKKYLLKKYRYCVFQTFAFGELEDKKEAYEWSKIVDEITLKVIEKIRAIS